jgi:prepilin-type N-terminal cleavage/methylation domain-containing protein
MQQWNDRPTMRRRGEQGYSLIELLIVVVILGILAGIVAFGVSRIRTRATGGACVADLSAVTRAANAYEAATGSWPASINLLVDGRYLKNPPSGTYRFDTSTKTVSRDPACDTTDAVPVGVTGAIVGIGDKCVAVVDGQPNDGAAIKLATCTGGAGQKWTLPPSWPGQIVALGKCLDVPNGATANRTYTQLMTCDGSGGQQWNLDSGGIIRNPQSGRCFDAENATSADGTALIIWDCHGNPNQRWTVS